jgi:glucosyl-dolichyl phosphate glucuronosyltransferase
MDLSVIICTYNRATNLARTLQAIAAQAIPRKIRWELIVVDNNSTDRTADIVESYRSKIPVPVIYLFEKRQGKSVALNSGVERARGRVLVFTDDDVSPETHWLQNIYSSMEQNNLDGLGGKILLNWSSAPPRWLSSERQLLGRLAMVDFDSFSKIEPGAQRARIYGANMAFKRDLFAEVGGFDPRLGPVGKKIYPHEETDFVSRAVAKGKKLVYDPQVIVWHNIGRERMRKNYFRRWYFEDGENSGRHFDRDGRMLFGVPLFAYRFICLSILSWLCTYLNRPSTAFLGELEIWKNIGFCWGCLKGGHALGHESTQVTK